LSQKKENLFYFDEKSTYSSATFILSSLVVNKFSDTYSFPI